MHNKEDPKLKILEERAEKLKEVTEPIYHNERGLKIYFPFSNLLFFWETENYP